MSDSPDNHHAALLRRVAKIPITDTLKMKVTALGDGRCTIEAPFEPEWAGVFESLHGGILMTLADSAACYAVLTRTGPDAVLTTTDMSIRFLAPCLTGVRVEATAIKVGRTMCPVGVEMFDAHGTKVAVAQVAYIRLEKMPRRPAPGARA